MTNVDKKVEVLLNSKNHIRTLSNLVRETSVSEETLAELSDIVSLLEMHENECRRLRQNISLRLRQYSFNYYKEHLFNSNLE